MAKDEKHRVDCSLIVAILDDSVLKSYQIDQQAKMTIFQREAFPKTDRFVLIPMLGRFHIGQIIFFSNCSSLKLENDRIFHGIELILEKLTCRQKTIISVENFESFEGQMSLFGEHALDRNIFNRFVGVSADPTKTKVAIKLFEFGSQVPTSGLLCLTSFITDRTR